MYVARLTPNEGVRIAGVAVVRFLHSTTKYAGLSISLPQGGAVRGTCGNKGDLYVAKVGEIISILLPGVDPIEILVKHEREGRGTLCFDAQRSVDLTRLPKPSREVEQDFDLDALAGESRPVQELVPVDMPIYVVGFRTEASGPNFDWSVDLDKARAAHARLAEEDCERTGVRELTLSDLDVEVAVPRATVQTLLAGTPEAWEPADGQRSGADDERDS